MVPNRWQNTISPTDADLKNTGVLRVDIVSASAKVRTGGPGEDRADAQDKEMRERERVWLGVVPSWMVYGNPIPSRQNRVEEVPAYINNWVNVENEKNETYARQVASQTYGKK